MPASTGTAPDSHSARRRPSARVSAEANGVTSKMPTQALAANRPMSAVGACCSLRRRISHGVSMK
jgi:hypothetical protein